ncbi:NAD(P)-binding domain-containing protein [Streptomyces sp. NPDC004237]|uniref:NAD(P)-binding domain-containing protein n=1 Tax=Streptomyces sp. NPDC004237 TaxID=3154455 RepID=UPI0033AEA6F8
MTDISVLGIGRMGSAIARKFLEDGHRVTVWNRTPRKTGDLEALGARPASDAADAFAASPVSVLTVLGYGTATDLLPEPGSLTGKAVVNFTSGDAASAVAFDSEVVKRGGRLLEGVLLCYPSQIGSADAVIHYSGSQEAWEAHRDVLQPLAGGANYLGAAAELANVMDEAALAFSTPILAAAMEAAVYGEIHGLSVSALMPRLASGFPLIAGFLATAEQKIANNDFTAAEATLDVYLAGVAGVASSMKSAGIDARVLEATVHQMTAARDAAGGGADFTAVYSELLRRSRASEA